ISDRAWSDLDYQYRMLCKNERGFVPPFPRSVNRRMFRLAPAEAEASRPDEEQTEEDEAEFDGMGGDLQTVAALQMHRCRHRHGAEEEQAGGAKNHAEDQADA